MDESSRFSEIFFGHAARLVRLARLLGDDDPEDVVQESFCKLYAARAKVRDESIIAYLNKTVVNEVRSRHRRRVTAKGALPSLVVRDSADASEGHGERQAVMAALNRLPQRQREAVVLRFWLDLPMDQIAHVMGTRSGTVKSQISRGLDAMEATLNSGSKVQR